MLEERDFLISIYEKYGNLLSQSQRQAFHLYYIEDLSYAEIAEETATSRAAAFDSVKKASKKLIKLHSQIK